MDKRLENRKFMESFLTESTQEMHPSIGGALEEVGDLIKTFIQRPAKFDKALMLRELNFAIQTIKKHT